MQELWYAIIIGGYIGGLAIMGFFEKSRPKAINDLGRNKK